MLPVDIISRGEEQITALPDAGAGTLFPLFRFTGPLGLMVGNSVEVYNPVNMDFNFFVFRNKFADAMTKTIRSAKKKKVSFDFKLLTFYSVNIPERESRTSILVIIIALFMEFLHLS